MKKFTNSILIITSLVLLSCNSNVKKNGNEELQVVTTTTMITDIVKQLGGNSIKVSGLMGAGVDPHLYQASEGDVNKLYNADIVFYNGLHLEGKLEEVFEKMKHRGVKVVAVSDTIDKSKLIGSEYFASNYDPHTWFDLSLWRMVAVYIANTLIDSDQANTNTYKNNLEEYLSKLDSVSQVIDREVEKLPKEKRVLVTAHDAFNYFGRAYDFDVMGLQGISTATEAGVKDVQNLANVIVERKIKAIFVESSVSKRNIQALQAAVKSKGFEVTIGGELYSDACGSPGTKEGTYLGMFQHNVTTIVDALK